MESLGRRKVAGEFSSALYSWMAVEQQVEPAKPPMNVQDAEGRLGHKLLKWNMVSRIVYIVFAPLFLLFAELTLLVSRPLELSPVPFFADFEISRSVLFGTALAVFNIAAGSIMIGANDTVSVLGTFSVCTNLVLLLVNVGFVVQFAIDDKISVVSSLIVNCKIPTETRLAAELSAFDDEEEIREDCPFYRTMKYRERVNFSTEKRLLRFQVAQLIENLRINLKLKRLQFDYTNFVTVGTAESLALFIKRTLRLGLWLEEVNTLTLRELKELSEFVLTPDERSVAVLYSRTLQENLVPWNADEIRWQDGFPWSVDSELTGDDFTLFPLTATIALTLLDPEKLVQVDIGSSRIGDEMIPRIQSLVEAATNLVHLELSGTWISIEGFRPLMTTLADHASLKFFRISSVLHNLEDLRTAPILDISLPRLYADAVERCVEGLYRVSSEQDELRGDFFGKALIPSEWELADHIAQIRSFIGDEYRLVGRDFFRSLPPTVVDGCVFRVAHRLGKFVVPDPSSEIDIPKERAVDGHDLDQTLIESKLFPLIFSELDIELVATVLSKQNFGLEELDLRGMPLLHPLALLRAVRGKRTLKTLNLSYCKIADPEALTEIDALLADDFEELREVFLRGNLAFDGKKGHIWSIIGQPDRVSHPRVVLDIPEFGDNYNPYGN